MFDVNEKLMRDLMDTIRRRVTEEIKKAFEPRTRRKTGPVVLDTRKHPLTFSIHLDK